jgi:predicted nucleotidyltransferase
MEVAREVAGIVRRVIANRGYRVFLFGSWASGQARKRSDIDIGIEGPARVDPALMLDIREACEALPTLFTIEIVDFASAATNFRKEATARILELEAA